MLIKRIRPSSRFKKSFAKLPPPLQKLTIEKEAVFIKNPFSPELKTHKLKGEIKGLWSFSITHSYRIIFEFIKGNEVIFYDIGDHRIYQ